jgi:ubiquinone/menaquinone biosynthesis C-methylase UbiE
MIRLKIIILFSCLFTVNCFCQTTTIRPYKCGYFYETLDGLQKSYNNNSKNFDCKKGETIASVGASCGYVEAQIAVFIDNIHWYIQDIDTSCLNQRELNKVIAYHEKLKGTKIIGNFTLVIGDQQKTNLPSNTFDRVLLANVYHELTDRKNILTDIYRTLKPDGVIVIMERVANRRGKRHHDCNNLMLYEPDFLDEMRSFSYMLIKKAHSEKNDYLRYYTFKKIY